MTGVWICANGHEFTYGDEDWHEAVSQGWTKKEHVLIPCFCTHRYENGEPCNDSTSLILQDVEQA